ncbi:MAG: hypothetical protein EHM40_00050 [Chloroflexi bacterium]|nr:MAG: hypothetical protein EHM40_05050 [Chloroflexota bacterium]RPI96937.1 MAG: hypothetical protein EHM40_00050 [Chloroflexota bacterium]
MKNKKFYVFLAVLPALILIASLNLDGKALSMRTAPAQVDPGTDQRFTLPSEVGKQIDLRVAEVYSAYTRITDNAESISVSVPVEWSDIDTGPWTYNGRSSGIFLSASTDLSRFNADGSAPGLLIGVSSSLARTSGKDQLLGAERADFSRRCIYKGNFNFQGLFYNGSYDNYSNCSSGGSDLLVFTTTSADRKLLIMLRIAIQSDADLEAASKILETFQVLGNPETDSHHDH